VAIVRKTLASAGFESFCNKQQLPREMVQSKERVIQLAPRAPRVRGIVQLRAHPPGRIEAACDTREADGVEAVGIL
jgi:hypothetical protein